MPDTSRAPYKPTQLQSFEDRLSRLAVEAERLGNAIEPLDSPDVPAAVSGLRRAARAADEARRVVQEQRTEVTS